MKVNELAGLSGINPETIRSYRLKGFLKPKQLENGYYDYSFTDYISLVYLRKLRGYSFSMEDVRKFYSAGNNEDYLSVFEKMEEALERRIQVLQQEKKYLEFERRHFAESLQLGTGVQIMQSIDEKIDFFDLGTFKNDLIPVIRDLYPRMTPTVRISREILNGECEDRIIPIRTGLGTYRHIVDEFKIPVPQNHSNIPNGIHAGQMIKVDNLAQINLLQLKSMMDYAKEKGKQFLSDTTGYLMHIENEDGKLVCHFRIRACIEANDIRSLT